MLLTMTMKWLVHLLLIDWKFLRYLYRYVLIYRIDLNFSNLEENNYYKEEDPELARANKSISSFHIDDNEDVVDRFLKSKIKEFRSNEKQTFLRRLSLMPRHFRRCFLSVYQNFIRNVCIQVFFSFYSRAIWQNNQSIIFVIEFATSEKFVTEKELVQREF